MKQPSARIPLHRISTVILTMLLVLLAPAANAVTKHLSMVGENGKPMASTTITISFPDGKTKEEKDTDDKGILMFDFNKSGTYTLSDPEGNVLKTVSITGTSMSTATKVGAGVVAVGLIALLASGDSSDNSNSGDTPPGETEPPVTDPPVTDPPEGGGGEEGSQAGTYDVSLSVASNPGDHPVLLQQLVLRLVIIGTALTIIQVSNNPNFPAQMSGSISDGSFTASANGVYSGFPTFFQIQGAIVALTTLSFLLTVGGDGSLPGAQPITYNGNGTKQ